MSGSSYWPRSAVNAYGIAPRSRIHASAQQVSRPPENAMPIRSPTGSESRMTPLMRPPSTAWRNCSSSSAPVMPSRAAIDAGDRGLPQGAGVESARPPARWSTSGPSTTASANSPKRRSITATPSRPTPPIPSPSSTSATCTTSRAAPTKRSNTTGKRAPPEPAVRRRAFQPGAALRARRRVR